MNEIENEIAEMGGLTVPEEPTPPVVEPPVAEPPVVEPPIPAAATPSVEPPIVEPAAPPEPAPAAPVAEPTPAPVAPAAPSSEVELLKAQLAQQNAAMAEMRAQMEKIAATATTRPVEQPTQPAVGPDGKPIPTAPSIISFVETEDSLDEALKTKDNFNTLMTHVVEKAQESVLTSLPQIVARLADSIVSQRMAAAEFYSVNKDLAPNKAFVSMVANELAAANPGWTMQDMMGKLGDEVRKRLAMIPASTQAPITPPATPPVDVPAFAPPGGTRPGGGVPPAADKLAAEIMELLDV